jgi:hypothetical protein
VKRVGRWRSKTDFVLAHPKLSAAEVAEKAKVLGSPMLERDVHSLRHEARKRKRASSAPQNNTSAIAAVFQEVEAALSSLSSEEQLLVLEACSVLRGVK